MQNAEYESHVRARSFTSISSSLAPAARETYTHVSDSEWDLNSTVDDTEQERQEREPELVSEQPVSEASRSSDLRHPPLYDQAHLTGTTQGALKLQQHTQQGEKTAQEKTEEEIVIEYVKKQSLLEMHYRGKFKGKGRAIVAQDEDGEDDDLQRALEASMAECEEYDGEHRA